MLGAAKGLRGSAIDREEVLKAARRAGNYGDERWLAAAMAASLDF